MAFIPNKIQEINSTIFSSSSNTLVDILEKWPQILAALGVIAIGYLIMRLIQWLIVKISKKIFLHTLSERSGFTEFLEKAKVKAAPSEVIANFVGGYVFTLFFLASSKILGLHAISEFLDKVISYIPNIVVALFIVLIGFQLANTIGALVESTLSIMDSAASKVLGLVAKNIIIIFSILAALIQLNIAEELVKILFIGVVAMTSLAGGLALGLGGKDFVANLLKNMNKK